LQAGNCADAGVGLNGLPGTDDERACGSRHTRQQQAKSHEGAHVFPPNGTATACAGKSAASNRLDAGLNLLRPRWMMARRGNVRGHGGRAMQEERKNGGNGGAESGEPQFTTPGAGEQFDETVTPGEPIPGPMEGQGGERREAEEPAEPRAPRKSAARRKGGAKKAGGKRKKGGARTARPRVGAKRKGKAKARGAARGAARSRGRGKAKAKRGKAGRKMSRRGRKR
jgi:hypothetical protein